ncbi:MAG: 50S ribosomal protein L10 [Armatimonas sp.]
MAQPKKKIGVKPEIVDGIKTLLAESVAVILTEYRGLSVPQAGDLRKKLNDGTEADFSVVKNTLFKRAAAGVFEITPELDAALNGPTAAIFAKKDSISTAKALADYIAANRNTPLKIKGGVVDGKFETAEGIQELASIPPREVLLAQFVGAFTSALVELLGTLTSIADKKEAEGAPA